ncbi:hypothetical protein M2447_002764 [Ereboglobus sp. PH5-10]|uniref:immunoglobulin domain-containing protein n=1 Tax=Ereboglobus sp. PH5-10 TaxID=2940629 RepID=UPI002405C2A3|nr:immunoglobulin domain-containing protein [Ereboglobus sp. PH5-10]MDF9828636.1 hypothetical protein [Ereboglobus sp. PH5-10]
MYNTDSGRCISGNGENANSVFYHPSEMVSLDKTARLSDVTIRGGSGGSGVSSNGRAAFELLRCVISGNAASRWGGGMYNDNKASPLVRDCVFSGNTAADEYAYSYRGGGAAYNGTQTTPVYENCIFYKNTAFRYGGALCLAGDGGTLTNCIFYRNSVGDSSTYISGGAIYMNMVASATVTLVNCTIAENSASGGCSGISASGANKKLVNCIVWGNTGGSAQIATGLTVSHSIIEGGYVGTGNLDQDPLLQKFEDYDGMVFIIPIAFGSCAVEAGITQAELGDSAVLPTVDARGVDRTAFERPTIGAYEPQAIIPDDQPLIMPLVGTGAYTIGSDYTLNVVWSETRAGMGFVFKWYKDGILAPIETSSRLSEQASVIGTSNYRVEITLDDKSWSAEYMVTVYPDVIYVSGSGDDVDDGATPATAKRSLDKILANLPYGGNFTINVLGDSSGYAVNDLYTLTSGVTLNIADGAIIKFADGAGFNVESGATLNIGNATLTHLADDTVGGDTNEDGNRSVPSHDQYTITGSGQISISADCDFRFKTFEYGGTLSVDQIWIGNRVYRITSDVVVPNGVSLTILEGAILKFDQSKRITVQAGGSLYVAGARNNNVIFTSIKDDVHGGDTNGDGISTIPSMGDWRSLLISGHADFRHCKLLFGGNTNSGSWSGTEGGVITYLNGSTGVIDSCLISDGKFDGVSSYATSLLMENTTVFYCDRAINVLAGEADMVNCVFHGMTGNHGVLAHGGTVRMHNSVLSKVSSSFVYAGSSITIKNSLFWNPAGHGPQSYSAVGSNGNLWGDPLFHDAENGDFTLKIGSPCIDAGDGSVAPERDYFGQERVDDMYVENTGVPASNGACPDIGIHEMSANAVSDVDLAVSQVVIPASANVGDVIQIRYTVTNVGSLSARGTCRSEITFVGNSSMFNTSAGAITSALSLEPSESVELTANVTVPSLAEGDWHLHLLLNSDRTIFEGRNTDNNLYKTSDAIRITMAALGGTTTAVINGNSIQTFRVETSASEAGTILIYAPEGLNIYGALGYVPGVGQSDIKAVYCGDGVYAVTVPQTEGSMYLTIENTSVEDKTIQIEKTTATLSVLGASTSTLPNTGQVTFSVYGTGFTDASAVELRNGTRTISPKNVKYISAAELSIVVSPENAVLGDYDLVVINESTTATLSGKIQVKQAALGGVLKTDFLLPSGARAGRVFWFTVTCTNVGDADLSIPMVTVTDPRTAPHNSLKFSLDGENYQTEKLQFLSLDNNGGFSAISPGESATTIVYCQVPANMTDSVGVAVRGNTANDDMSTLTNDIDYYLDVSLLALASNVENIEANQTLSDRKSILGNTNGEFIKNLVSMAQKCQENGIIILETEKLKNHILGYKTNTTEHFVSKQNIALNRTNTEVAGLRSQGKSLNIPISGNKNVRIYMYVSGAWIEVTREEKGMFSEQKDLKYVVLAHGMNDSIMNSAWRSLASKYSASDTVVFGVDWSDWAKEGFGLPGKAINPRPSASHIREAAKLAWGGLVLLGISGNEVGSRMLLIGHSHGAHLSGHMANDFGAARHVGLDTSTLQWKNVSVHNGSEFYPAGKLKSEYYRTSQIMGRDDAYANENYIIIRPRDLEDDPGWGFVDDLGRHSYAVEWFTNNSINGKLIEEKTSGKITNEEKKFNGLFVSSGEFEGTNKIDSPKYTYHFRSSNWTNMYSVAAKAADVIGPPCPVTAWEKGKPETLNFSALDTFWAQSLMDKAIVKIRTLPVATAKVYMLKEKSDNLPPPTWETYTDNSLYDKVDIGIIEGVRDSSDFYKFSFQNITIPHDAFGPEFGYVNNNGGNMVPFDEPIWIVTEYNIGGSLEVCSSDNYGIVKGTLKGGTRPVAAINGNTNDNFVLVKKYSYTQKEFYNLLSGQNIMENYTFNASRSAAAPGRKLINYRWTNRWGELASGANYSFEISKAREATYDISLTVTDDNGYTDSVTGCLQVTIEIIGDTCACPHHPCVGTCNCGKCTPLPAGKDPNEMSGPTGAGELRYIIPGEWLDFKVYFENMATATGAAQEVHVNNALSQYLDWSSFELAEVSFANQIEMGLRGLKSGQIEVAQKGTSTKVRVEASYSESTGKVYWYMRSVDPSTADKWPLDPYAGFLLSNDETGRGEGYVAYRVKVKADAPHNVRIDSSAEIVFDYNDPIVTDPAWFNTVYAEGLTAPEITMQPSDSTKALGASASFTVAATGYEPMSYQWYKDGVAIDGQTSATLTLSSVLAGDAGVYTVTVTNIFKSVTSEPASLTVLTPPEIVWAPNAGSQTVQDGATATFAVDVTGGSAPFTYEWFKDNVLIASATAASYTTPATLLSDNGAVYKVEVSNAADTASLNATLTVVASPKTIADQYKSQIEDPGTPTVTISGTVDFSLVGGITIPSGKTIVGADSSSTIIGDITIPAGASDITIKGVNITDGALAITGASEVDILHCTFVDAPVSISGGSDNISFSWNEFTATATSEGGGSAMTISNAGAVIGIALEHNLWGDGLKLAMPAVTNARVHMYNNYIAATGNTSATVAGAQAQVLSLHNIYQGTRDSLVTQSGGLVRALDNFPISTSGSMAAGGDRVFVPSYSYVVHPAGSGEPLSASELASLVQNHAGNTAGKESTTPASQLSASIGFVGAAEISGNPILNSDVPAGGSFTLLGEPRNFTPVSYQWYRDNFSISGATGTSHVVSGATSSAHAGIYAVAMTASAGEIVFSKPWSVTVGPIAAPVIVAHPVSQTVNTGGEATFVVTATGEGLSYQWLKNNTRISGATGSFHSIAGVQTSHAGNYSVMVMNPSGTVTSNTATLTVTNTGGNGGNTGGNNNSGGGGGGGGALSLWWMAVLTTLAVWRIIGRKLAQ